MNFKDELASIYAAERRAAAEEAVIERQLAAAWFLSHPEEWLRSAPRPSRLWAA